MCDLQTYGRGGIESTHPCLVANSCVCVCVCVCTLPRFDIVPGFAWIKFAFSDDGYIPIAVFRGSQLERMIRQDLGDGIKRNRN